MLSSKAKSDQALNTDFSVIAVLVVAKVIATAARGLFHDAFCITSQKVRDLLPLLGVGEGAQELHISSQDFK